MNYTYQPAIGFDTETHQLAMGQLIPPIVCLCICMKDGENYETQIVSVASPEELNNYIQLVIEPGGDIKRVAHNTAFDLAILAGRRPDLMTTIFTGLEAGIFEDTIVREKLLHLSTHGNLEFCELPDGVNIKLGYSLADLSRRYLGKERKGEKEESDSWRTYYKELETQPINQWPLEAQQYVAEDAEDCLRIREIQEAERVKIWQNIGHDPFETQSFQVAVSFALYLMSAWGFKVDHAEKARIEAELAEDLKPERMAKLLAAGILRPCTPPTPYKNGAVEKCEACQGTGKGCAVCNGLGVTPRMKGGVKESIDKKALIAFIEAWAKGQTPPVELKKTAPTDRNPFGQVSTEIEFFKDHQGDHPIFEEYYHRASLQKLVTTEMPRMNWNGKTADIVHPCFDVLKMTGRTSSFASSIYPSFNCQNVHPKVRGCFIPRPGHVLFSIDYSGMELGTLAQKIYNLFGSSVHRDKINANVDNHTFLGSQLAYALDVAFNKACVEGGATTPDQIYETFARCKDHKDEAVKKFFAHYRKFAKPTGLGYPGGLGPKTFVQYAKATYGIVVDLEMATRLRDIWHQTYPEMKPYFRWVTDSCVDPINSTAEHEKYAYTTPFGMYRAGADYCSCANGAALQAFSAEGAKLSVFSVIRACYDPTQCSILYGKMKPMAFIHDEILGEVPDNAEAHDLVYEAARLMIEAMSVVTPDVQVKCSPCLMRHWSKSAEPVFGADGRLKVWEPNK